jgi:GNAT superfamily N-acetyltransferase
VAPRPRVTLVQRGVRIEPFEPADQETARAVVLAGLVEHCGALDEALNPDLDDIATAYADGTFLVARLGRALIGTGALLPRTHPTGELVRMSVRSEHRGTGVGTRIFDALLDDARARGIDRVMLETTATWTASVAFYRARGFRITHTAPSPFGDDVYLARDL